MRRSVSGRPVVGVDEEWSAVGALVVEQSIPMMLVG